MTHEEKVKLIIQFIADEAIKIGEEREDLILNPDDLLLGTEEVDGKIVLTVFEDFNLGPLKEYTV